MGNSSKSVIEILSSTRNLLADPARWTKTNRKGWARSAKGRVLLSYHDSRAARWGLAGALSRVVGNHEYRWPWRGCASCIGEVIESGFGSISDAEFLEMDIESFNDDPSTTHADILAVLDRAIDLAKAEEGKPA